MKGIPQKDISPWIYFGFPFGICTVYYGWGIFFPQYIQALFTEYGFIENLTAIILLSCIVLVTYILVRQKAKKASLYTLWHILLLMGCIYFLGEELSWGQHLFGWYTPNNWATLNEQKETNLHNLYQLGYLFSRWPENIVIASIVIGGIFLPLYIRYAKRPKTFLTHWIMPTIVCLPTAVLVFIVRLPKRLIKYDPEFMTVLPQIIYFRTSEIRECLTALFIFIYLCSITYRQNISKELHPN